MKPTILMLNLLSALLLAGCTTPSPLRGRRAITESRNLQNPASHCDIAWAGGLATEAHMTRNNAGLTSALG